MSKLNRREFLENSMFATAAAIAASAAVKPEPILAQEKTGANDKLSMAVIGVRGRGGDHINGYVGRSNVQISYICDCDEKAGNDRCDQIEKRTGKRPVFVRDLREIMDKKDVDCVSIATPNHWHCLAAIWAMQSGKDVYVEKPVSYNIGEGCAITAAMKKYNKICQVGTQCRSSQGLIDMVKFIAEGGIGEVNFARGFCYKRRRSIGALGDYAIPDTVDFNLWSGPAPFTTPKVTRPQFHYDWHWQRLYGNGDSGNQGPHQTDIARWGLGLDCHPNTVIAYGGRLGYQAERKDPNYVDAGDTPNTEVAIYDYGKKCIVFETRGLDVNNSDDEEANTLFQSKTAKIGVIFYGSEGYICNPSYTDATVFDKDFKPIKSFHGGGDHFGNFLNAVVSRDASSLNAPARCGHLSAAMAHLANTSYYLGENNKVSVAEAKDILKNVKSLDDNLATLDRTVKHLEKNGVDLEKYPISIGPMLTFDPEKEVFTGARADEANQWITRQYRDGFVCPSADNV